MLHWPAEIFRLLPNHLRRLQMSITMQTVISSELSSLYLFLKFVNNFCGSLVIFLRLQLAGRSKTRHFATREQFHQFIDGWGINRSAFESRADFISVQLSGVNVQFSSKISVYGFEYRIIKAFAVVGAEFLF